MAQAVSRRLLTAKTLLQIDVRFVMYKSAAVQIALWVAENKSLFVTNTGITTPYVIWKFYSNRL
jgi:hypothetical protein